MKSFRRGFDGEVEKCDINKTSIPCREGRKSGEALEITN